MYRVKNLRCHAILPPQLDIVLIHDPIVPFLVRLFLCEVIRLLDTLLRPSKVLVTWSLHL